MLLSTNQRIIISYLEISKVTPTYNNLICVIMAGRTIISTVEVNVFFGKDPIKVIKDD